MTRRTKAERHVCSGSRPRSMTIRMSDVAACPTHRLDVPHYRPDGTCVCVPPRDEALEPHLIRGDQ